MPQGQNPQTRSARRFGLITTNSITQSFNRRVVADCMTHACTIRATDTQKNTAYAYAKSAADGAVEDRTMELAQDTDEHIIEGGNVGAGLTVPLAVGAVGRRADGPLALELRRVSQEGMTVVAVPGPSAITAALSIAGLPVEHG